MGATASSNFQDLSDIAPADPSWTPRRRQVEAAQAGFFQGGLRLAPEADVDCSKLSLREVARCVDQCTWSNAHDDAWVQKQLTTTPLNCLVGCKSENRWCALGNVAFLALHANKADARRAMRDRLEREHSAWAVEWDAMQTGGDEGGEGGEGDESDKSDKSDESDESDESHDAAPKP